MSCAGVVRPVQYSSTNASVVHPTAAGSTMVVNPRMTPADRIRSTRRFTAGADSETREPISAYDARASATSDAMILLVYVVDLQRFASSKQCIRLSGTRKRTYPW